MDQWKNITEHRNSREIFGGSFRPLPFCDLTTVLCALIVWILILYLKKVIPHSIFGMVGENPSKNIKRETILFFVAVVLFLLLFFYSLGRVIRISKSMQR